MKKLLFILWFWLPGIFYGQKDNMNNKDTNKINILKKKRKELFNGKKISINEILRLNDKINSQEQSSITYRYLSDYYSTISKPDSSLYFINKAIISDSLAKNNKSLVLDYNQKGRILHRIRKYKEAVQTYKKGLGYAEKYFKSKKSVIYGNLGTALSMLQKNDEAIQYFLKQEKNAILYNDYNQIVNANYYIASTYLDLEQYKKAEKYFFKALSDSSKVDKSYIVRNFHGLGILYSKSNKFDKALKYDLLALLYFKEIGDKLYIFDTYNNIATMLQRSKKYEQALKYSDSAIQIIKPINKTYYMIALSEKASILVDLKRFNEAENLLIPLNKSPLLKGFYKGVVYENLYNLYKNKGDSNKALSYFEKFTKIQDSILKAQRDSKISLIENKYQTEKKDKQILQLKAEQTKKELALNKARQEKIILSGGLLAAFLFMAIFSYYYSRNQKQKEMIERLQRELHHRIKNNLATISAMVDELKRKYRHNDELLQNLNNLNSRIYSINQIHKQLYKQADVANLSMRKYVDQLAGMISTSFQDKPVIIENQIPDNLTIKSDKSLLLGLLINEFITNSFKHAFTKQQTGKIQIKFLKKGQDYILQMIDNGKGLPPDFDMKKVRTFGLDVMQLLTKQLKGKFYYDGSNGMMVKIIFPE